MKRLAGICIVLSVFCAGCNSVPSDALRMNKATLEDRRLQTRLFETTDESMVLSACNSVLQDLGFNLDESETALGLIVASKDRGATDAAQVAGAVVIAAVFGGPAIYDTNQKIRVSIITARSKENSEKTAVRVTFQRAVWNNQGQVSRLERLNEPEMYQGFFDKLSKSLFLEAQGI